MEFLVKSGAPEQQQGDCVVAAVFDSRRLSPSAQQIDTASGGLLSALLKRGDMDGKLGQTLLLHDVPNMASERVLLVGCGKEREFHENNYRTATMAAVKLLNGTGAMEMISFLPQADVVGRDLAWKLRAGVLAAGNANYRFDRLKSKTESDRRPLRKITMMVPADGDLEDGEQAVAQGRAIGLGVAYAKDLGNLPGNLCTPAYLADQARELQNQYDLKTTVLDEAEMEKLGMGALLSVARGSRQPAKLIVMEYRGGKPKDAPVALVGKGLTFDAGGISIKPAAGMDEMKYDMCGAASVFGVIKAVAELKLPINLVGVVPSSENLPDGAANKPGDVVTSMSGQTIEILNTDAEGRLILCDALTYTERFDPEVVIDIATLTGACVVALGAQASGLLGNHEPLVHELLKAGKAVHDRAWQLPLWEDYQPQLDSNFADMANVGGREAGTITAACFLSRYAKKFKWAHLDIAGTAWLKGKEKGATGRPVPLLMQYLIDKSSQ